MLCAILSLAIPSAARASDMTGAIPYFFGFVAFALLVLGFIAMLAMHFVFKCNGKLLVAPFLPALAVGGFTLLMIVGDKLSPKGRHYHRGPELGYNPSGTCDLGPNVSRTFDETQLARLYDLISSAQFKSDLARYVDGSVSNYVFAVDLSVPVVIEPATDRPKPWVFLAIRPAPDSGSPVCAAIKYLFMRAVAEIDPSSGVAVPSEPPRIK